MSFNENSQLKKMDKELLWVKVRVKCFLFSSTHPPARLVFLPQCSQPGIYTGLTGSHRPGARIRTQVFWFKQVSFSKHILRLDNDAKKTRTLLQ